MKLGIAISLYLYFMMIQYHSKMISDNIKWLHSLSWKVFLYRTDNIACCSVSQRTSPQTGVRDADTPSGHSQRYRPATLTTGPVSRTLLAPGLSWRLGLYSGLDTTGSDGRDSLSGSDSVCECVCVCLCVCVCACVHVHARAHAHCVHTGWPRWISSFWPLTQTDKQVLCVSVNEHKSAACCASF